MSALPTDFLRKHGWREVTERIAKSVGMVAGQERPTVQAPDDYKQRFEEAMDRYFVTVNKKRLVGENEPFCVDAEPRYEDRICCSS